MLSLERVVDHRIALRLETSDVVRMNYFGEQRAVSAVRPNLLQRSSPEQVCGENVVALRPREPIQY